MWGGGAGDRGGRDGAAAQKPLPQKNPGGPKGRRDPGGKEGTGREGGKEDIGSISYSTI